MNVNDEQTDDWIPNHEGVAPMVRGLIDNDGLTQRLADMGFASVTDFVEAHPGETYYSLAKRLDTRPIFISYAHGFEAVNRNKSRRFSMEVFVREMRHVLSKGWIHKKDQPLEQATIVPISRVQGDLESSLAPTSAVASADRMWKALLELDPPLGWLPEDINDPLIQKAFEIGWPEEG